MRRTSEMAHPTFLEIYRFQTAKRKCRVEHMKWRISVSPKFSKVIFSEHCMAAIQHVVLKTTETKVVNHFRK